MSIHERRFNSLNPLLPIKSVLVKETQANLRQPFDLIQKRWEQLKSSSIIDSEKPLVLANSKRKKNLVESVFDKVNAVAKQRLRRSGCRCTDKENKNTRGCRSRFCEKKKDDGRLGANRELVVALGMNKPKREGKGSLRILTGESRMARIPQSSGSKRESSEAA